MVGVKLDEEEAGSRAVRFDVSAKLEERERQSGKVVVLFGLIVRTKPNVVKYEIEGRVILTGKDAMISKMLSIDPVSKIPLVFNKVYQHAFTAIYSMASLMGTIYPPPNLLFSAKQGEQTEGVVKAGQVESQIQTQSTQAVKTEGTPPSPIPSTASA